MLVLKVHSNHPSASSCEYSQLQICRSHVKGKTNQISNITRTFLFLIFFIFPLEIPKLAFPWYWSGATTLSQLMVIWLLSSNMGPNSEITTHYICRVRDFDPQQCIKTYFKYNKKFLLIKWLFRFIINWFITHKVMRSNFTVNVITL